MVVAKSERNTSEGTPVVRVETPAISDAKEKEVYKWYFTTSGADNYVDKFRGMKIKKIEILGEPNSKGGKDIHEVEKLSGRRIVNC